MGGSSVPTTSTSKIWHDDESSDELTRNDESRYEHRVLCKEYIINSQKQFENFNDLDRLIALFKCLETERKKKIYDISIRKINKRQDWSTSGISYDFCYTFKKEK